MRRILFFISIYGLTFNFCCHDNSDKNSDIDSSLIELNNSPIALNIKYDSLRKYSYFVFAPINDSNWHQGSGFFIRQNNKLYFISALHVFSGRQSESEIIPNYPDTLYVRLITNKRAIYYLKLDISFIKKKKNVPHYLEADAYAYLIDQDTIPKNVTVYSIDHFIEKNIACNEPKETIICGYPNLHINDAFAVLKGLPQVSKNIIVQSYCDRLYYSNTNSYDSIEYSVWTDRDMGGYSGSPVYLLYRNKIIFGGLLSSGTISEKHCEIVRPQYVLDKIH